MGGVWGSTPALLLLASARSHSTSAPCPLSWERWCSHRAPSVLTMATGMARSRQAGTWSPGYRWRGGACREKEAVAWGLAPRWASPSRPLGRPPVAGVAREGLGASPPDGPSPSPGEGLPQPRLEDEIDFLAQELARQEAGHSRLTAPPQPEGRQRLLEAASTLGLSERGRGPNLGLPSTRGAPTPRTSSLRSTVSSGPVHMSPLEPRGGRGDSLALLLIVACSVAGAAILAVAVLCWCRLQRDVRLTQKADYAAPQAPSSPATPRISQPGDQRLAHSAEMYHYQHQRQQMRCLERHKEPPKELDSASSDEENEDGDFTVYECPGLAPTGEMEVRNPLFDHASLSAPPLQ
ncbi:neural proliferation differentiation and control protein 1 isoform X1 [Balaenoptera acutorostrata]|uniref:Neural proliferation differentiation and control protein 1 isoform X1 n=1 Tax=Balaenoptera acutorostrata TaxID=9767 RepID=A0ABM3TTC0_BALAC|nr:neural proliferation differentiation and control protein 1 isoform X1 [Balaenoptera acutorostrata]